MYTSICISLTSQETNKTAAELVKQVFQLKSTLRFQPKRSKNISSPDQLGSANDFLRRGDELHTRAATSGWPHSGWDRKHLGAAVTSSSLLGLSPRAVFYSITHSAKQAKQLDRVVFWRKYLYVSDRLTQLAILCGALSAALSSVSSDGVDQKQKPNQNPTKDHRPLSSAWTKAATISGAINGRRGLCSGVLFFLCCCRK